MDAAARNGMYTMPYLKELAAVPDRSGTKAAELRRIVTLFKDHPGLGVWKGDDEPEWGKKAIPPLAAVVMLCLVTCRQARLVGPAGAEPPGAAAPVGVTELPRGEKELTGGSDFGGSGATSGGGGGDSY